MADKKTTITKKETAAKTVNAATAAVAAKKTETPAVEAKKETAAVTVTEKKKPGRKPSAKKAAAKTTAVKAPRKTAKKSVERVQEVYFEFDQKQIEANQVVKKIEEAFKAEGHQIGRIKDLKVYINPEESRAYYVINGKAENKFVEL